MTGDYHMSEGASIQAMCHSQIKRKVIGALDVSSTATRRHAGYCMSAGEPASTESGLEEMSLSRRKLIF